MRTLSASAVGPSAAVTNNRGSSPAPRAAAQAPAATRVSPESTPQPTTITPRIRGIQSSPILRCMAVTIDELVLADSPELWSELGFRVHGEHCDIGTVRLRLSPAAGRRVALGSLKGVDTTDLDGLATSFSAGTPREPAEPHPNGVT